MRGKVISVNKLSHYIEVEFPDAVVQYTTENKQFLHHTRRKDAFYVHDGKIQGKYLSALTPPLISPDREEMDYYVQVGKIKISNDYDTLTRLSTSFSKQDIAQDHSFSWWRKNIVQRSFRLLGIDMGTAKKVAQINKEKSLEGTYEAILGNPLIYPFISLETCQSIMAIFGKKIPESMLPLLRVSRKVYENLGNGWVYTPEREVRRMLPTYMDFLPSLEKLKIVKDEDCFYYSEALEAEKLFADCINKLAAASKFELPEHIDDELSEKQRQGLELCLTEPLALIDGCAGAGKTTLIAALTKYLPSAVLVSLTGKAVSRLKKISKNCCMTIHKLLYSDLTPEIIIIDEASMVPLLLMVTLLSRCPLKKLVMVGDPFQLPPIDYGRVFERLLDSKKYPTVTLDQVFRTKENTILENSFNLRKGTLSSFVQGDNFKLVSGDMDKVFEIVKEMDDKDVTIVSPYTRPLRDLNRGCQEIYHKKKRFFIDLYGNRYFCGDRVMCTENDYERDVFNGEGGVIIDINEKKMKVEFSSGIKEYSLQEEEDMSKISLRYATSVHKAQGSEHDNVIFFLENRNHGSFLNQRMIYTTLTRAKETFHFVGSKEELITSCRKNISASYDNIISRLVA
ncbi:RecD/TraA family helicase repair protein [Cedratvirus lausannensis]|uniref:RecD/TraA family helicase repair protein n=1 Tax=Cedratvirus lausannensis TaxID=2023205 RepID=A0A285PXL3_9VIRU|nr:RecD/TraA family helicase [Cedratvirus borely]WIL03667.1 RecD/TraA family helicase [Cedratvirus plubellavi]SOB74413.1 RecD/TraA family helicase repair protein [Cedratvirus lausannensis]